MPKLKWSRGFAFPHSTGNNDLLHQARTPVGSFEIYDDAETFLLVYPLDLAMPAEVFPSLKAAKAKAEEVREAIDPQLDEGSEPLLRWALGALGMAGAIWLAYQVYKVLVSLVFGGGS